MRGLIGFAALALVFTPLAVAAEEAQPAASPAPVAANIDPTRLAAATITVDHVFPEGTYARMMKGSMDAIMGTVLDSVTAMPLQQIAVMAGMTEEEISKLGDTKLAEIMEIYDPAYRQRMEVTMRVTMDHMTGVMSKLEPEMRAGLSRAYAARFTEAQLGELNAFFSTPTGSLYAAQSMMIFLDPQVMEAMQKMMPLLMQEMPGIQSAVTTATADLPPPRALCDLDKAERGRLAKLLGLPDKPGADCDGAEGHAH
jgi:hypothetical protein